MVTTTAVWEINNKHFSELIGLFLGNLQVTTVVSQYLKILIIVLKYRWLNTMATISYLCKMTEATIRRWHLLQCNNDRRRYNSTTRQFYGTNNYILFGTRGATIHDLGVSIYCCLCITIQRYIVRYSKV